jgi:hypothetical protein
MLVHTNCKLTINVPLILRVPEIKVFPQAKHIMEHFVGQLRGQKGLGPLEKSQEMPYYMFSRSLKK